MIEHRLIERAPAVLRAEAVKARSGKLDPDRIDALVEFMRVYADRCHHGKEEDILFAELSRKHLPATLRSILDELVAEHSVSRQNVRRVADANARYRQGDASGLPVMASALDVLASLYPGHIRKEDERFFIPCMDLFTVEERRRMLSSFEEFDRKMVHETYLRAMDALQGGQVAHPLQADRDPGQKEEGRWACIVCDHVYRPSLGDEGRGIPPGTAFEDLPEDWTCPICGAGKSAFHALG